MLDSLNVSRHQHRLTSLIHTRKHVRLIPYVITFALHISLARHVKTPISATVGPPITRTEWPRRISRQHARRQMLRAIRQVNDAVTYAVCSPRLFVNANT